jgi:large subunit ribosomal protein L18
MQARIDRRAVRRRVRHRIRKRLAGTASRPRLAVFRSHKHIYVQAIDDEHGRTVAQASTQDPELKGRLPQGGDLGAAKAVGEVIARKLKAAGIESAVLDRGGFVYHGRVQALADSARSAGLRF